MIPDQIDEKWTEEERLAALERYAILDTPPDRAIDDLVRLAAELLEAPIAAVNLIDSGRQWFKSELGLGVREMPLDDSICKHALLGEGTMVVPDASQDPRFARNPLVTAGSGLRFYAGALLSTPEGLPLGTLCVLDRTARPQGLSAIQRFALQTLAEQVMAQFELQRQAGIERRLRSSESARLRGEQRYRTVLDSIDVGFCIIEMIQDDRGEPWNYRILEVNPAFVKHTGLEGAVGRTIRELVPVHDIRWSRIYGRVASTGLPVRVQQHSANLDRWLDVYAAPLGDPDSQQVAVFLRDVTEERERREALQRLADDLATANRRQSEFLATLAHELRNPLAPMRAGLDLLRIGADKPGLLAKVRPMMERQVNHLVHLVDDLLDLARISSGKVELKMADVSLKDVLQRAVEMALPGIDARRHAFRMDIADEGMLVHVDAARLAQVVGNLLSNAAKYTMEGGSIVLEARREQGPGARAYVAVRDSGIGIPAEALPNIFDMFTQVGRHPEQESGGLGIGLHLVKQMTELHGGSVRAESPGLGKGSVFTIELPLAQAVAGVDGQGAGTPASAGQRPLRILLADDNADAVEMLRALLEIEGHRVDVAGDGLAALEAAAAFLPDVAFLDIGMPGLNGYEVARRLRATPALAHARLVAVTGWGTQEDRARSEAAGFDAHLTKPVDLDVLKAIIASCG
ncbi:ATP-binding protein [Massilia sp. LXY-6]|uniref:ATP-binding protein n=1 Tax=Massilia sp. LXY-6 TaxID=3379823 RepID=UPI003EE0C1FF